VERSAALLDQEMPGWESRIDLDRLDICDASNCVLGQVYASRRYHYSGWSRGLELLGFTDGHRNIAHYAFTGNQHLPAWRAAIEARRQATTPQEDMLSGRVTHVMRPQPATPEIVPAKIEQFVEAMGQLTARVRELVGVG
jgi:hypothetical protein